MNDKCFEMGVIQAFLDGEASPELSFKVTDHAANCDRCALAIAQAEEENAQVFAMLDREMNTLVPSQRLWSSISVAISEERKHASVWERFRTGVRAGIRAAFVNPSIAMAASVLIVFGIFAAVWNMRTPAPADAPAIAAGSGRAVSQQAPEGTVTIATTGSDTVVPPAPSVARPVYKVQETAYTAEKVRRLVRPEYAKPRVEPAVATAEYLPGEESYVKTISSLKQNVDGKKDLLMTPSTRVSFERDLAVVNDTIKKMKDVVRKNPKNQAAKQVLYSSYQDKIDLLNSVVEREELMASMQ